MPRTPPPFPTDLPRQEPQHPCWELTLETITPMFGGSAVTRKVDTIHPVRAASVRGHLRFWWRATAGASFRNAEELFRAEEVVWGSAQRHGAVRVEVLDQKADKVSGADFGRDLTYALFPFQSQRGTRGEPDTPAARSVEEIHFTLRLTCPPEYLPQIQTAVKAWVMFGGIGARTRRGCGSLEADGWDVSLSAPGSSPRMLTTLPGMFYQGKAQRDPLRAWEEAVRVYKEFRQQRNAGSGNRPGRSHWPESDSIRRLTPNIDFQHTPIHSVQSSFPRADLGLPINFHFQKQREYVRPEPKDHTLQGTAKGQERFASPIITKAVAVAGSYTPLLIILDAPHVWEGGGVGFRQGDNLRRQQLELTPAERRDVRPLNGKPIREALADFVQQRGFSEVKL